MFSTPERVYKDAAPPIGDRGLIAGPDVSVDTPELHHLVTMFKAIESPQTRKRVIGLVKALAEPDQ